MVGKFNPSQIVDEVYSILSEYETKGIDLYERNAVEAVIDYFENYLGVEYLVCCSMWPDETGGICAVSFVEEGHPQLVLFDYEY